LSDNNNNVLIGIFRVVRVFRGKVFSWHQGQYIRFKAKRNGPRNTRNTRKVCQTNKYRVLIGLFRVVRVFRGKVFSWHQWQDICFKAKELNHERHEIHEKVKRTRTIPKA
jgi:hypothetical protein